MTAESGSNIVFIGSVGGHMSDLYSIGVELERKFICKYITFSRPQRDQAKDHFYMIDPKRSLIKYIVNAFQSTILLIRLRPKLVISSGAGFAIPFTLLAFLFRIRTIHFELACQIERPSSTGKFLQKMGIPCYSQSTLLEKYGFTCVHDPFSDFMATNTHEKYINKIFVALGNTSENFDRILNFLKKLHFNYPDIEICGQFGYTSFSNYNFLTGKRFFNRDEFLSELAKSDCVITHGGVGVIIESLNLGHMPIIIPREVGFGEHFDWTQVPLAEKVHSLGIGVCLREWSCDSTIHNTLSKVSQKYIVRSGESSFTHKFIIILNQGGFFENIN